MCNILVVDDEADIREAMSEELEALGHKVYVVQDGQAALRWLADRGSRPPCLIILDLRMPRMDGWDFLERLRKQSDWIHLPVVVLSASLRRGEPRPVMRAQAFWAKPPLEEDLRNISQHCEVHALKGVS